MDRHRNWIEPAHLRDPDGFSPPVPRLVTAPGLAELIRWFWMPSWDLAPGVTSEQRSLQYPVCLLVISTDYDRLLGPTSGLATKTLAGRGWACGVNLTPGAGRVLARVDVSTLVDDGLDLRAIDTFDGAALAARVHELMGPDPRDPGRQADASAAVEAALAPLTPLDDEGRLVNDLVDIVETDPSVTRVHQLAERVGMSERTLQRVCQRRIGLGPKSRIQLRRLHEAADALRAGTVTLAEIAARIGYADQAHLTRDFRRVTGKTPAAFAAEPVAHEQPPT